MFQTKSSHSKWLRTWLYSWEFVECASSTNHFIRLYPSFYFCFYAIDAHLQPYRIISPPPLFFLTPNPVLLSRKFSCSIFQFPKVLISKKFNLPFWLDSLNFYIYILFLNWIFFILLFLWGGGEGKLNYFPKNLKIISFFLFGNNFLLNTMLLCILLLLLCFLLCYLYFQLSLLDYIYNY